MHGANEIREVLTSGDRDRIFSVYQDITGKELDRKCGDCLSDARIFLQTYLNGLQRETAPIYLYVGIYKPADQNRAKELEECLWQNHNNPHIDKVIEIEGRPTFQYFFNRFEDRAINVLVNSDIFFDETISLCKIMKPNACYALTRYDWNGNGTAKLLDRYDAQDAWIFRGRVKGKLFADYPLGVPGCDNRIAYEIKKAGYIITNPARSIHALHYHQSGVRSYNVKTEAIPQPYHFVHPCALT